MNAFKVGFAEALGFLLLLPACLLRAWTPPCFPSIKPLDHSTYPSITGRRVNVDRWHWGFLNAWYDNVEDGVSGAQAYVWNKGGTEYVPYSSTFPSWVPKWAIAYAWSAWRNGANNLKRPLR